MAKGSIGSWVQYKRENLRRGFYNKRTGYILMIDVSAIILIGALLVYFFEHGRNPAVSNYFDSLYMIIITIATVGYGDISPITAAGRTTVILVLVFGIGTLSAFITLLAGRRAEKVKRRYSGLQDKLKSKDHVVVCGWNTSGEYVLGRLKSELQSRKIEVILLCDLEESPAGDDFTFFYRGDPTSVEALERVNVAEARSAILLADESKGGSDGDIDARTVLSALNIRDMNPDIEMTAQALRPENIHHLELAGVREILDVTSFLGNIIARSALHYGMISTVSELVSREAGLSSYSIPVGEQITGKSRAEMEAELREECGAQIVAVTWRDGFRPNDPDYRFQEGDRILVFSAEKPPGAA